MKVYELGDAKRCQYTNKSVLPKNLSKVKVFKGGQER